MDINNWIDLFFGINQQYCDYNRDNKKVKLYYFPEYMERNFLKYKTKGSIEQIDLKYLEFGMMPYQIYNNKSKIIQNKSSLYEKIKDFNEKQFASEHKVLDNYKIIDKCFECSGSDNINFDYYYIIEGKEDKQKLKTNIFAELEYFKSKSSNIKNTFFEFRGNNLGDIEIKIKKADIKINKKDEKNKINSEDKDVVKSVILRDHTKPIKYIDYNKRLNMFLSYSLDGFINIYCFPSCKLVRSIKVSEFTKGELEVVVLVSNPFPMIFTCDKVKMFIISINGELIKEKEITQLDDYSEREIVPIIDKDFGIVNDYICFLYKKTSIEKSSIKKTETKKIEIELPFLCPSKGINKEEE